MRDFHDLRSLKFLERPSAITISRCPDLQDISWLNRWSESLRSVSFRWCEAVDLAGLSNISNLRGVDLSGSGALDLTPLTHVPQLEWILMGDGLLPALHPLRSAPALSDLHIWSASDVDLSPLAGKEGLAVKVDRSTTVHGAERLGSGSRVVRR
jgi:hypothetical protein